MAFFSHLRMYLRWYIILALAVVSIVLWRAVLHEDREGLLFTALNVGQGDALFIESPTGMQVVIDGGPGNALSRELSKVIPWYDKSIDLLLVTNPDKDHYEGFLSVLDRYSVGVVLESGTISPTDTYVALEEKIARKNIPRVIARRGQIIDIGGGAYIEVLFPDRDVSEVSSNDGSIVARLVYGEASIMLQGDSTAKIEEYLLSLDKEKLKSDVLKVGHHGSRTSTTDVYIEVIDPDYAVISSGLNNSYGHPHKETLDTLTEEKVTVLDTCVMGGITLFSQGTVFTLKNKKIIPVAVGCK